jgi:hypothetical protein
LKINADGDNLKCNSTIIEQIRLIFVDFFQNNIYMKFQKFTLIIIGLVFSMDIFAQKFPNHPDTDTKEIERHKGKALLLHIGYGVQLPALDMKKRYGWNNTLGGGLEFMPKSNWIFGLDGHFIYGTKVKEDPIKHIRTDSNYIINSERTIASVVFKERGFYMGAHVGKLFTFGSDARRGLRVTLGAGYLQHKIKIQDDSRAVTQLTGEYLKGYDRLNGGLAFNQFIGYQLLGKARTVNFYAGFEFNEGFTHNLRSWDFELKKELVEQRFDLRYGFRFGWFLPFYARKARDIYY